MPFFILKRLWPIRQNKKKLTYNLTDRMFEKIVQNFMPVYPSRQITQTNSVNCRNRDYSKEQMPDLLIRKVKSSEMEPRLLVSIWETQSTFEMFDYENKGVKTKEYQINGQNDIYMANMDKRYAKCIVTKGSIPNDNTYCGTVEKSKGNYYFTPGTKIQTYRVVGSDSKQQCSIKVGDMIRIGRMKYFIKETYDKFETNCKQFDRSEKAKQLSIQSLKTGTCKFCLCDEKDNPDLLISPCNCKGSCAQVHLECLKQWLANKVSRRSTAVVQFLNYDNFNCELCKEDLPTSLKIDGKLYNMLEEAGSTKDPYMVLQGISNKKSSTTNNLTIKIKFTEKQSLILGRGHQADVRLEDVSISRQHCIIKFIGNRFYLSDNNSKFGTLMKLNPNNKANLSECKVQIARMTLQMSKPDPKLGNANLNKNEARY